YAQAPLATVLRALAGAAGAFVPTGEGWGDAVRASVPSSMSSCRCLVCPSGLGCLFGPTIASLLDAFPAPLVRLFHRVRHDPASQAPLDGAARARDLIGEGVAHAHDDGSPLDREKTGDGLLGVVPGADVELPAREGARLPFARGQDVGEHERRLAANLGFHP